VPIPRAVRIKGKGGVEVLAIEEIEIRPPGPGEVLIEVAAAGLNRADILQRRGLYPAPPGVVPDVPGLEYAGKVAAIGHRVTTLARGDRVMGITGGGGMATHIVVHEREVLSVPEELDLEAAAAIPEVFLTAFDALVDKGELRVGHTVLLHSVASGVGTAALQLALRAGAHPIGTARTQAKLDRCRDLGLRDGVLVREGSFAAEVDALTRGHGVDLILDTVGAAYLEQNVQALAPGGRIVIIGLLGGQKGTAPLGALLRKRATIVGSVLRSRPLEEKAALAQRFAKEVLPMFADGRLKPVVDAVLPMDQVAEAHARMERDQTFGKIVLSWESGA
jgi:NADPH2:quinone reductase